MMIGFFVDSLRGWYLTREGNYIVHTSDGGQSWQIQDSLPRRAWGVYFLTPAVGWVVGDGGTILYTIDGGKRWQRDSSGVIAPLFAVQAMQVGMNVLCYITTGGAVLRKVYGETSSVELERTEQIAVVPQQVEDKLVVSGCVGQGVLLSLTDVEVGRFECGQRTWVGHLPTGVYIALCGLVQQLLVKVR